MRRLLYSEVYKRNSKCMGDLEILVFELATIPHARSELKKVCSTDHDSEDNDSK